MITMKLLRAAPLVLALAAALAANAQSSNPPGPATDPTSKKVADTVVKTEDKVANSRPVQATKRGVKRATNAVKNAGSKTAAAIRNAGNKINKKVPPGPNDQKS